MAETEDKWVEAVAKLIKLTQENKIKWHSSEPPTNLKGDADDYVETVFLTKYNDRNLRLYKRIYKRDLSPLVSALKKTMGESYPRFSWYSSVVLEILDLGNNKIWTFPTVTPLEDLLTSVRFQVADVNAFIEKLLNEPEN